MSGGIVPAAAISAASGALGMIGQRRREKRAMNNQRELMGVQYNNQRLLNQQGHELQMDAWKKTNYPAQVGMMKEAGLSVGKMYGQGGQGGVTGSQGGGGAASGNAPAPQPMEIGNMLQGAMMKSQIKVNEATAKKLEADADSTRGGEGTKGQAEIQGLMENINSEKVKQTLMKAQKDVQDMEYDKAMQEVQILFSQSEVDRATIKEKVRIIQNEAVQSAIRIEAQKQGIKLDEQKEKELWHKIRQEWVKSGLRGLDIIVKGKFKDIGGGK